MIDLSFTKWKHRDQRVILMGFLDIGECCG